MQDLKKNLLRYNQREQLKGDIAQAEDMLKQAKPEDRGAINANINRTRRQLDSQSPVPLTAKEKDTLNALEKKLLKRITTNMPPEEVMRKNPAGAIDWHMKWEKINKPLIGMWKNCKIQLNPDSSDKDLSNLERYRPSGAVDRLRTDAQISGVMSYGAVDQENWDAIFTTPENTALAQVKRHYNDEEANSEVEQAIEKVDKEEADAEISTCSPEQRAILAERLAKGREVLAKKRAEEKQIAAALEEKPVQVEVIGVV